METILRLTEEAYADERENGAEEATRGTQLLGFTGVILSLVGSLGGGHLSAGHGILFTLPQIGDISAHGAFQWAFVASVALLVSAAVVALWAGPRAKREVLNEQGEPERVSSYARIGLANDTLDGFQGEVRDWTSDQILNSMISATVVMIEDQRKLNGIRARRNRLAGGLLTLALLGVSLQGAILVLGNGPGK